jgi:hypothetical protein
VCKADESEKICEVGEESELGIHGEVGSKRKGMGMASGQWDERWKQR